MIIYNIDQKSEAWFSARCGRITSTRFKNLVSKETTDSYKDLVNNLACEIITGKIEDGYTNALMEQALEIEPLARQEYEWITDIPVKTVGFITPDEDHKYHNWIGDSPDGLILQNDLIPVRENEFEGILEIKCPLARTHFEYIEADKLPSEYRHQVQGHLFVTGLKYCDFVSFVPNMKLFIIRVYPDLELHAEFEKRLEGLIKDVENKLKVYENYNIYE